MADSPRNASQPPSRPALKELATRLADADPARLVEALRADQSERWRAGARPPVEDYLAAFPALRSRTEDLLVLIWGEVLLRAERDEKPPLSDYQRRFPDLAELLGVQFALEAGLAVPTKATVVAKDPPPSPSPAHEPASADHNLLFGVLALQADLIDARQFVDACSAWAGRKETPLADILVERGWLTAADRADVEKFVRRKLKKHGGDVRASLGEAAGDEVRQSLAALADPAVQESLAGAGGVVLASTVSDPNLTRQRYALRGLQARGGIGQVWLAHDAGLGRDVALKELRPERAGNAMIRGRFLEEAQITGQLEHPGVAPVYELARDPEDGRPFYTMRFVKGRTLSAACKEYHRHRAAGEATPLELRDLLGAFVAVCQTVAYAHSRGVVHRDLKGANVILGKYGEAIVLDWGLAKVLGAEAREAAGEGPLLSLLPIAQEKERSRDETEHGQVLGTPSYMAPEQAEGRSKDVDARTDVYGLGAMLYEILTGEPPFQGADTREVLHQVVHAEPIRPRDRAPGVPPPLEAVCLKCLAKRPAERYASAQELGREVQRYLAGEPVDAYPEPAWARLVRWGRRHQALVAAAGVGLVAVTVALASGMVLLGRANRQIEEQRDDADRQRALAEKNLERARQAVDTSFTQLSEEHLLHQPGLQPLRQKLLRSALEYYQAFVKENGDNPALRRELASAYRRAGYITAEIGSKAEAEEPLQKAVELLERLRAEAPQDQGLLAELARTYYLLAEVLALGPRPALGEEPARRAITLLEPLWKSHRQVGEYGRMLGRSHDLVAVSRCFTGRFADAKPFSRQGIAVLEQVVGDVPGDLEAVRLLALARNNLAVAHQYTGARAEQQRVLETAVAALKQVGRPGELSPALRGELTRCLAALGYLHYEMGRLRPSEELSGEAVALLEALVRDNPKVVRYRNLLGGLWGRVGEVRLARGQPALARVAFRRSIDLQQELNRIDPGNANRLINVAWNKYRLGQVLGESGQLPEAVALLGDARTLQEALVQKSPENLTYVSDLYWCRQQIALVLVEAGRMTPAAAVKEQLEVLAGREDLIRRDAKNEAFRFEAADARVRLGELRLAAGDPGQALKDLEQALAVLQQVTRAAPDNLTYRRLQAHARAAQARVHHQRGEQAAALTAARQALALAEALAREDPAYLFDLACSHALGASLTRDDKEASGHTTAALDALRRAVAAGYDNAHRLRSDPQFAPLRSQAAFTQLLDELEARGKTAAP